MLAVPFSQAAEASADGTFAAESWEKLETSGSL